jgi:PAS domain S-box-containing protein
VTPTEILARFREVGNILAAPEDPDSAIERLLDEVAALGGGKAVLLTPAADRRHLVVHSNSAVGLGALPREREDEQDPLWHTFIDLHARGDLDREEVPAPLANLGLGGLDERWNLAPLVLSGRLIGVLALSGVVDAGLSAVLPSLALLAVLVLDRHRLGQQEPCGKIVRHAPAGIVTLDAKGTVTSLNLRAEQILGYRAAELLGTGIGRMYADEAEPRRIGRLLHEAAEGVVADVETYVVSRAGEKIPIRQTAIRLLDPGGASSGSAGYFEDLRPERRQREREGVLLRAGAIVAEARSLSDGLQRLVEAMVLLHDRTFCCILLEAEDGSSLTLQAASSGGHGDWQPGLDQRIQLTAPAILKEDLPAKRPEVWSRGERRLYEICRLLGLGAEVAAMLIAPLRLDRKPVGYLILGSFAGTATGAGTQSFSQAEISLASAIADLAAALLDRIKHEEKAEHHERLISALTKASHKIRMETGSAALLDAVVRLAGALLGAKAGVLYLHRSHLGKLEIAASFGVTAGETEQRLAPGDGLPWRIMASGKAQLADAGEAWLRAGLPEELHRGSLAGAPLGIAGAVEGVLLVGSEPERPLQAGDLEVLVLFASQAAIALETSRLAGREERTLKRQALLHALSYHVQTADELEAITFPFLTAVTAGYGLGFNRAVLLLLDDTGEELVGSLGIGQVEMHEAVDQWRAQDGVADFAAFLQQLGREGHDLALTVVGERARQLRFPKQHGGAFDEVLATRQVRQLGSEALGQLPAAFREALQPATTQVLVPLISRGQAIGILVVDHKFTLAPISDDDIDALLAFSDIAAAAIENLRSRQRVLDSRKLLRSLAEAMAGLDESAAADRSAVAASSAAVKTAALDRRAANEVLLERALGGIRQATLAGWVAAILIDELGVARLLAVGEDGPATGDIGILVRPEGISREVMRNGNAFAAEDLRAMRDRVNPRMFRDLHRAALCLPLAAAELALGVVWIHYPAPRHFTEVEIDALQLFVAQAAAAYARARRLERLVSLREAAAALAGGGEPREVLLRIVAWGARVLQANAAVLWLYDTGTDSFILEDSVCFEIDPEVWKDARRVGPHKGGTAYAVMREGWVGVADVRDRVQGQVVGRGTRRLLERIGANGFQGVSLQVAGERLGVLYAAYGNVRAFSAEDREVAADFASHAYLALGRAKLLHRALRANHAAEAMARVIALEDRAMIKRAVVSEIARVLNCDAVVLFEHEPASGRLVHPPTMLGVRNPAAAELSEERLQFSLVHQLMEREQPYIVKSTAEDSLFKARRFAREEEIISCVAIPLAAAGQKVGMIFLNYRTQRSFTQEDLDAMGLFAIQAAAAIRNAQLLGVRGKESQQQATLAELSHHLLSTVSLRETMEHAVRTVASFFDAEYCAIVLRHADGKLIFHAGVGWEAGFTGTLEVGSGARSQLGLTIERGAPLSVNDYATVTEFEVPPLVAEHGIKSGLSAPMKGRGEIVGAILVQTTTPRRFTAEDEGVLTQIANDTAAAIQSARKYEASEKLSVQRSALVEAAQGLTAHPELDWGEILSQIIVPAVRSIIGAWRPGTVIASIEQAAGPAGAEELVLQQVLGVAPGAVLRAVGSKRAIAIGSVEGAPIGLTGRAVHQRKPVLVGDVSLDSDYLELWPEARSELAVPIFDQERPAGVVNLESRELEAFDRSDAEVLEVLAQLVSTAITLKRAQDLVDARTALAWVGMASTNWMHVVRKKSEAISDRVASVKGQVEGVDGAPIDHGLLGELDMIAGLAKFIREELVTPPPPWDEQDPVPLDPLIFTRLEELWRDERFRPVRLDRELGLGDDERVMASGEWLKYALDILVENAVEAAKAVPARRRAPRVKVVSRRGSDAADAWVEIIDNGPGIPPAIRERLFNQRIEKHAGDKGSGIGLLIANAILSRYHGQISHEPLEPGTKMLIRLPLATRREPTISPTPAVPSPPAGPPR